MSTPIPVFEVDEHGATRHALTLHPTEPFGAWVQGHVPDVDSGFHATEPAGFEAPTDLPWFLQEARPSGFLGRAWARAHADRGWPADPGRWTGDDVLRYATRYGTDLPGAFVVGEFALEQLERRPDRTAVVSGDESTEYPERAARALSEAPWASSAGGEQPKFAVAIAGDGGVRHHLVKFSPPLETPGGRRWADLLVVEHLVHELLRDRGIAAPSSRTLDAGGRRFLEVDRFDRHGARGRSGLASLATLDPDGVAGDLRRWSLATAQLAAEGRLRLEDHQRVVWLEAFGHLIANTDMHPANLSFRMRGTTLLGLAPVYDMLPMFHAPRHGGELPAGRYAPSGEQDLPPTARAAAEELWRRVADRRDVSRSFRAVATEQAALIR